MNWANRAGRALLLGAAARATHGTFELVCRDRTWEFRGAQPGPSGTLVIDDERAFARMLFGGDRGLGESYVDGDWSSPDLVALLRVALRNAGQFNRLNGAWSWLSRQRSRLAHWIRANTPIGSRRNIAAHYDLGNEFFRLFLDEDLVYSAAWYESPSDTLERAQRQKLDRICRRLGLGPGDHLLEIGTGWGAFAEHAATRYGCRVTTTTISREQHDYARERFAALGEAGRRIHLLFDDYRDLRGRFDRIASIEMFEAVGLAHYDDFFSTCDRLLAPDGAILLQTIAVAEQDFGRTYGRGEDWMQGHVFPGSELACLSEVLRSVGRVTTLRPFHLEDLGAHYARTIAQWRARFLARRADVERLGFDARFIRTWDLYLAFSQAAFAERHISDVQLLLTRAYHDGGYVGDPGRILTATYRPSATRESASRESAAAPGRS
jgi:cyclopropane-fatty-acyl-phospholipid synthase